MQQWLSLALVFLVVGCGASDDDALQQNTAGGTGGITSTGGTQAAGALGAEVSLGGSGAGGVSSPGGGDTSVDCLASPVPTTAYALPTNGALRYLALGDSYTIGESVPASFRWPVQLAGRLREAGLDVVEPELVARTGYTVLELDAAIDAAAPAGPFELVSLLIGVNDQYRGYPLAGYEVDFRAMLLRAIDFAGGEPERVLVLSIPDWGVTPFATGLDRELIAEELDAFNAVNASLAAELGARYVDVTEASRAQAADLVAADGLHPSARQYAIWACLASGPARAALWTNGRGRARGQSGAEEELPPLTSLHPRLR